MKKKENRIRKSGSQRKLFKRKHPITLKGIVLIAFCLYLISWIIKDRSEIWKLKKEGVVTPGYIYNEKSGVKADEYRFYRFSLSKGQFKGVSRGGDENMHIGDSIQVVYLPSNPSVNRSLKYMEKYKQYKKE